MSIDAIAVLPEVPGLTGEQLEGDWRQGPGPGGGVGVWFPLTGAILLNVGWPVDGPDADLYAAARSWAGDLPPQIWVFPDTAVPDAGTGEAIIEATRSVGRWVAAGPRPASLLRQLGFSEAEEAAWQREVNSGNPQRVRSALASLERRLEGRDPAEVEALLSRMLNRPQ